MAKGIKKVAKETPGILRGFIIKDKCTWWWDTRMQDKIKVKKGVLKSDPCVKC